MNNAEVIQALFDGDNVLCANGTVYRHNPDTNELEFLPESRIKANDGNFKRKGKGDALSNPVKVLTDDEVAEMVRPATVTIPAAELDALRQRIDELQASGR